MTYVSKCLIVLHSQIPTVTVVCIFFYIISYYQHFVGFCQPKCYNVNQRASARNKIALHVPRVPSSVERWRPSLVRRRLEASEAVIYVAHNSLSSDRKRSFPDRPSCGRKTRKARKFKDKSRFAREGPLECCKLRACCTLVACTVSNFTSFYKSSL